MNPVDDIQMDPEFKAMAEVFATLKGLDQETQSRVLDYVRRKLGLVGRDAAVSFQPERTVAAGDTVPASSSPASADGVSPIAGKWLRRSGLSMAQLENIFSIDANDEIDLVAKSIPGTSKAARVHEVMLLKSIANYLSTGVPKITHDELKQVCAHYNAYDPTNHSKYIKSFEHEFAGSKSGGYTLNARGLAAAADLIKQISGPSA